MIVSKVIIKVAKVIILYCRRVKLEHLNNDQILYLKDFIVASNLLLENCDQSFNVFVSQINKIEQKITQKVDISPKR